MTEQQYHAWLDDLNAVRMVLVEVGVRSGGAEITRYLSTAPYVTGAGEVPAHQPYRTVLIADDITTSEQLSTEGQPSMTVGEIGLDNTDGSLDEWLLDVWTNREVRIYLGGPSWPRADFQLVFNGVVANIGSKSRTSLNLKVRDKLQRLNGAVSEVKLGGETDNKDALLHLAFGEVHNVTPLVSDPATLEYQLHTGEIERIIEVRDNGVPVEFTPLPTLGRFRLNQSPAGDITASVQGAKPEGIYRNTIAHLAQHLAVSYGKTEERFSATTQLAPGLYPYTATPLFKSFSRASAATYETLGGTLATAAAGVPRVGKGGLLIEDASNNRVTRSDMSSGWSWSLPAAATNYKGVTYRTIAKSLTTANEHVMISVGSVASGQTLTLTIALRAGTAASVGVGLYDTTSGGTAWGPNASTTFQVLEGPGTATQQSGGLINFAGLSTTLDTLVKVTRTYTATGTADVLIYPGTSSSTTSGASVLATRAQVEDGSTHSSYIPTTGAAGTRAADTMVVYSDIDGPNFAAFDAANQQPVGLPVTDRTNVLAACQQLATSVGAQVTVSRLGQLQLKRIDLQNLVPTYTIKPEHMRERALTIKEHTDVQAAVKLGFCKNWMTQPGLQTALSASDKEMFSTEWLTSTRVDEEARSIYRLTAEPVQEDTLLLRRIDAETEALRRLALRKVPRTTFQFEGYAPLLRLQLGQAVTLTHPRFNLENGRAGMVVSMSVRWARGRATVGVMT